MRPASPALALFALTGLVAWLRESHLAGERALYVREGLLTVRLWIIPYEKLQVVMTRRGPLQRLLGLSGDHGPLMGLDRRWAYWAIKAAGNYGEIFERNLGMASPIQLRRGLNDLWTRGGLMYAPPIR